MSADTPPVAIETAGPPPSMSHRVVTLLEIVGRRAGGIGSREAARETGIDRSAVSRIFRQLEGLGWVEQTGERGSYSTGPRLYALAAAVRERDSLSRAAVPLITELGQEFNETSYLAVVREDRVVFLDKVECTHRIRYVVDLHTPFPLTTGAAGRAVLSALRGDVVAGIIGAGLQQYTPSSITDPQAFRAQLDADREAGFAYSRSGWVVGGAGIASPFFDAQGECIGALTVSAPIDRLPPDRAEVVGAQVLRRANSLSSRLGYDGPPWPRPAD